MRKLLCGSVAALAFMAAPAIAADLSVAPIYKAPPAPPTSWTGTYIGLSGGGVWGDAKVYSGVTGLDETPWFDLRGGLVGITAGTQFQSGNLVLGFEGDVSLVNKEGGAFQVPPAVGFHNEVKERWLATYRGRIGVANDNWLFYATAGGAMASLQQNITAPGRCAGFRNQLALGLDRRSRRRGEDQPGLVGEGGIPVRQSAGQVVLQSVAECGGPERPAGPGGRPRGAGRA